MSKIFNITEDMFSPDPAKVAKAVTGAGFKIIVVWGANEDGSCQCGKKGCSSPGKHPIAKHFPNGVLDATNKIRFIKRVLTEYPDANIALVLEDLTVLDIDGPTGRAIIEPLDLPPTIAVKTARGKHLIYAGELPGGSFKGTEFDVLTGANRYTILPPSFHTSGHVYRFLRTKVKEAAPVPSILETLRQKKAPNKPKGKRRFSIPEGERNDRLFRMACAIQRHLDDEDIIFEMMQIVNEDACEFPLNDRELERAIQSSGNYVERANDLFGTPKQRTPLPHECLWYPYFPRHALTIIAGDPGRGKSLLLALIIAIITSGLKWPLTNERPNGNKVLLLSAEDNWARVTLPRLIKAGANIDNVRVMHKFRALTEDRLELLAQYIDEWKPDAVIIDTLPAYMGGKRDMHRQNEVGEFLAKLNEMAEANGSAIIALGHLNKQSTDHPLYRIVGSIGFAASIRSALFLGTDPDDPNKLALAHGKTNATEKGKTIIFEKVGGGRDEVPILRPVGFSDANEREVCKIDRNASGRPPSESEAAADFILDFLTNTPVSWSRVAAGAKVDKIASTKTLENVRGELAQAGRIIQVGKGRKAKWKLT